MDPKIQPPLESHVSDGEVSELCSLPSEWSDPTAANAEKQRVQCVQSSNDRLGLRRIMVLVAMSFLWTASQIPLYFYGGIEPQIITSIGGLEKSQWIGLGNLLPLAVITPFVGALSDLFGRKIVGMVGFVFIIVGNVVCATATSMNAFIAGSVLSGIGAGIGELVALAVAGEIVPPEKRGVYVAAIVVSIIPFSPAVLYAQLIAAASTWRWVGLLIGVWSFIGLVLTLVFYKPPERNSEYTRRELAGRIDYVGGLLSGAGLTLFLLGLTWAAHSYSWSDAHVLATFILGIVLIIAFVVWEAFLVKYPMFPARLKQNNPRILAVTLFITFASGANFFAVLIFWPTQYQLMYAKDNPVSHGVGSLPVGFGIIFGSIIATYLVSLFKGRVRILMILCCALMTAANGAMAAATLDNLSAMWAVVSLACLGVGAVIVPNQVIAGLACPPDLIGTITAATVAIRVVGGAIAYAVYGYIQAHKFTSLVPDTIAPVAAEYFGITSPQEVHMIAEILRNGAIPQLYKILGRNATEAHIDALIYSGKVALSESYPQVYYVSIAFGAVATIASFFLTGLEEEMKGGASVTL